MFLRYRQKSEAVQNANTAKIDLVPSTPSANLRLEEKLNTELETLKKEVLRLSDEEVILTKHLEVLSLSLTAEKNDLKMRLSNAENELLELQRDEHDIASSIPSNTLGPSTADSLDPSVDDDEIAKLELELETARLVVLGLSRIKLEKEKEKDKKNKAEMRRIAEAERVAKEVAQRAPQIRYPVEPYNVSGMGWGLDGSFGSS